MCWQIISTTPGFIAKAISELVAQEWKRKRSENVPMLTC